MAKLTAKQEMFVKEYLVDLNATQAAIRAGYSPKTANIIGPRLLSNVSIAKAVEDALKERASECDISIERTLNELASIGYADNEKLAEIGGRLSDKLKGLELLGKYQKLFTDKIELDANVNATDQARERLNELSVEELRKLAK